MLHSSGFARLEFESFYFVARFPTFYGIINYLRLKTISLSTIRAPQQQKAEELFLVMQYLS